MASTAQQYRARMQFLIEELGGKCANCPTTSGLQFDHIDHSTKSFSIADRWSANIEVLREELKKCQLLCGKCHREKTAREGSLGKGWSKQPRQVHGTVWSYTKYKC